MTELILLSTCKDPIFFYQVNYLKFRFNRWKFVWVILFIGILVHIFAVCEDADDDDDDGLLCGIIVLRDLFVCSRLYENLCTYHIVYQKLSNVCAISLIRTKLQIRFERRKYKHIACANIPFAMLCCAVLRCVDGWYIYLAKSVCFLSRLHTQIFLIRTKLFNGNIFNKLWLFRRSFIWDFVFNVLHNLLVYFVQRIPYRWRWRSFGFCKLYHSEVCCRRKMSWNKWFVQRLKHERLARALCIWLMCGTGWLAGTHFQYIYIYIYI